METEKARRRSPVVYLLIIGALITFTGIQTNSVLSLQNQNNAAIHSRDEMAKQLTIAKERLATMGAELDSSASQTSAFAKEAVSLTSAAKIKIDTCIKSLDSTISQLTKIEQGSPLLVQVDASCYEAQKLIKDLHGMVN